MRFSILAMMSLFSFFVLSHGDDQTLLCKRPLEGEERFPKKQKLADEEVNENLFSCTNLQKRSDNGIKDVLYPAKKAKNEQAEELLTFDFSRELEVINPKLDSLSILGFSLDEINFPRECLREDAHDSLLKKRIFQSEAPRAKRALIKPEIGEHERFIWQLFTLFIFDKTNKRYELNWPVLEAIERQSSKNLVDADWGTEINGAPALWWLAFAAYAFDKSIIELVDNVLDSRMDRSFLALAPTTACSYLTIGLMMPYAKTSFKPKNSDVQTVLKNLLGAPKKSLLSDVQDENGLDVLCNIFSEINCNDHF